MNTNKIYAEKLAAEYSQKETNKINQLKKIRSKGKNIPTNICVIIWNCKFTSIW